MRNDGIYKNELISLIFGTTHGQKKSEMSSMVPKMLHKMIAN